MGKEHRYPLKRRICGPQSGPNAMVKRKVLSLILLGIEPQKASS
jgi:hypothetical protein